MRFFDIENSLDYYSFGMLMPERFGGGDYRYSFQGQEADNEVKGKGNSVNYKYRMHDARLGRFFAVDPLASKYPHYTPYSFSGNKVIHAVELEGLEESLINQKQVLNDDGTTSFETVSSSVATCAECPNFNGLNGKGRYGEEVRATMLDGSVQSNYLETVEIVAERKTSTDEPPAKTSDPTETVDYRLVRAFVKIAPLMSTYDNAQIFFSGKDSFNQEQKGTWNRWISPSIGLVTFGAGSIATGTLSKAINIIDKMMAGIAASTEVVDVVQDELMDNSSNGTKK